jgi:hypothetical protein
VRNLRVDDDRVAWFREQGFCVLRGAFEPEPLAGEIGRALEDAFRRDAPLNSGSGGIRFHAVPMMSEHTPLSMALADALAEPAAALLGRAVLPGRAKGTSYHGETDWHRDSDLDIPSVGFVTYLEPVQRDRGALRVVPGSHRSPEVDHDADTVALETEPGDVIAFDEHLRHGSAGGEHRHQWRVDFIADPVDDRERELVRASFAHIFDVDWDGGYDADRAPSYGVYWQHTHPAWAARLQELGVIEMAQAHEAAMRARR